MKEQRGMTPGSKTEFLSLGFSLGDLSRLQTRHRGNTGLLTNGTFVVLIRASNHLFPLELDHHSTAHFPPTTLLYSDEMRQGGYVTFPISHSYRVPPQRLSLVSWPWALEDKVTRLCKALVEIPGKPGVQPCGITPSVSRPC